MTSTDDEVRKGISMAMSQQEIFGVVRRRPARQILTIADVRQAITEVADGFFGAAQGAAQTVVPAVASVDSGASPAASAKATVTSATPAAPGAADNSVDSEPQSAPALPIDLSCTEPAAGASDGDRSSEFDGTVAAVPADSAPQFTSVQLLGLWSESIEDNDRRQAREAAQLAAFALARVLNRDGGERDLDEFLSAQGLLDRPDPDEAPDPDPRISTQAGRLLTSEDLMIVSARMRKAKRAVAKRRVTHAIVWFLGFHNLLASVAQGRLPFERIARITYRVDDALLPMPEVQALDRYLDALRPDLSMDQFEKKMRKQIRTLVPVPEDPEAPRRNRSVRLERCDDDTGILTLTGPISVLDALFQRTRATARAIRRRELASLGVVGHGAADQGTSLSGSEGTSVPGSDGASVSGGNGDGKDGDLVSRVLDERTIAQLMFDLLAGSRPQTELRLAAGSAGDSRTDGPADADGRTDTDGLVDADGRTDGDWLSGGSGRMAVDPMLDLGLSGTLGTPTESDAPDEVVEVLCPTDGAWLRKQAAVHVTVPASTLLGLNDQPGWTTGDASLSATACREMAAHATSWVRILTDPVTGVVTDDMAQTYEPTVAMRRTVRQKWRCCTAPGCSRPAAACEIDHCCAFFKPDPARGGLTVVENLHPLCTHHHQLKTAGVIGLRRLAQDEIVWVLPMGVKSSAVPLPVGETDAEMPPGALLDRARETDAAGGMRGRSGSSRPVGNEPPPF